MMVTMMVTKMMAAIISNTEIERMSSPERAGSDRDKAEKTGEACTDRD